MKCKSCGFINDNRNKFCSNCGIELSSGKSNQANAKQMLCFSKGRHIKDIHNLKTNMPNLKLLWITVGTVIVSILIAISFDLLFHKYPNGREFPIGRKNSNPVIEAKVTDVASKFVCSCQTNECAYTSLESCACGTADKERQFIRTKLEKYGKPKDIIVELANKYGFLKSEFASKYEVSPSKVWNQN
ncbi:MAG: cytochrome c-type biogenesis protein [Ignavibacteriaceae bacterium]